MTNNVFHFPRFGLLVRQNAIHNSRLYFMAISGTTGGLLVLFFFFDLINNFNITAEGLFTLFVFTFMGLGVLFSGTAFSAFRLKEKTITYLLIPSSPLEKFLVEFFSRIFFFVLLYPILYILTYRLEGIIISSLMPAFDYRFIGLSIPVNLRPDAYQISWGHLLFISGPLILLTIPFTGASFFGKNPVIKTLFVVAILFFFNLFLVYLAMEIFGLNRVNISDADLFLVPLGNYELLRFFSLVTLLTNLVLLTISYWRLKEKEV